MDKQTKIDSMIQKLIIILKPKSQSSTNIFRYLLLISSCISNFEPYTYARKYGASLNLLLHNFCCAISSHPVS